ncbi:MAG: hypothetical protein RJQ09_21275 [Cyclobacteriaceae bacterium]
MKSFKSLIFSVFLAIVAGLGVNTALATAGVYTDPLACIGGAFVVRSVMYMAYGHTIPFNQAAMAGVNKEIWIDVLKENFYRVGSFLTGVTDWSAWVDYNTLNFASAGGDPTVLINNSTWPIATAGRTDTALTIALDTYDSENTRVRNTEEIEAAYDKLESVIRQHRNAIRQSFHDRAIHAYAPSADGANTPVILTTGAKNVNITGLTGTFKSFSFDDIANMQLEFDKNDWPMEGRVLVLHPDHIRDLMIEDKNLFKALANLQAGEVAPELFGFKIRKYSATPYYDEATAAKLAFGAAVTAADDTISSVAFLESEMVKAEGTEQMFHKPLEQNTEQRADEIGFQRRLIALPQRSLGMGAIISDRNP